MFFSWIMGTNNNTSSTNSKEEDIWYQWQASQPKEHFQTSCIFAYYKKHRTTFSNNTKYYNDIVYRYCFGDFSYLLVDPKEKDTPCTTILSYISLLVDFYDVCKGMSRRLLFSDPICITLFRKVIQENNIELLECFDFKPYDYSYHKIHAHTVSQYSLSTLLCFFVSNYLRFFESSFNTNKVFPKINLLLCQTSFINKIYGHTIPEFSIMSPAITIPHNKKITTTTSNTLGLENDYLYKQGTKKGDDLKESRWHSWPQGIHATVHCKSCKRITENVWGHFSCCLDCYLYKVCSVCGTSSNISIHSKDHLPRCGQHLL
jgi:hypothetical protein